MIYKYRYLYFLFNKFRKGVSEDSKEILQMKLDSISNLNTQLGMNLQNEILKEITFNTMKN